MSTMVSLVMAAALPLTAPAPVSAVEGTRVGGAPFGILLSRIGYDQDGPKHLVIRGAERGSVRDGATFAVHDSAGEVVAEGPVRYWGPKWRSHWWIIDVTNVRTSGRYVARVLAEGAEVAVTPAFTVGAHQLWQTTWRTVALTQLEARIALRNRNVHQHGPKYAEGGGWQDCGSYLREANSHGAMITGLLDLLEHAPARLGAADRGALVQQLEVGLRYLAFCQDKALELGRGEGGIIHEWPKHPNVITGDTALGALCFARAALLLKTDRPPGADEWRARATRSFRWLDEQGPVHHPGGTDFDGVVQPDDGFDRRAHGAPAGFQRPEEWMTRDLVTMLACAVALRRDGVDNYADVAARYAREIMARQITEAQAEGGFFGHFRTYASAAFSEKAWIHHHMGYDAGGTFPHYLLPLMELSRHSPEHAEAPAWREAVERFAYGYLLPACRDNPFGLLPAGYFAGEGLLTFSGLWHGMNGAYGSAAALALELAAFTGDEQFRDLAVANLQWIAGLNSGVVEDGRYVSKSMIYGLGDASIGSWTKIPGAICNGFESDRQFDFTEPKAADDGPFYFTDEDWITHSGGWLSALSRLERQH